MSVLYYFCFWFYTESHTYFIYINLISLASNNEAFKVTLTAKVLFLQYIDYKISLKKLCGKLHRSEECKANGIVHIIDLEVFCEFPVNLQIVGSIYLMKEGNTEGMDIHTFGFLYQIILPFLWMISKMVSFEINTRETINIATSIYCML